MSQYYSDPSRENDKYSLPDVEVFLVTEYEANNTNTNHAIDDCKNSNCFHQSGWYYWYCFPGCLPDSEAYGPFESEELAVEDMREDANDE